MSGNSWQSGHDPVQRWLRVVSAVVFLGLSAYLVADGRSGATPLPAAGIAVGTLLILLGYERLIRLPGIGRDRKDDDRPEWLVPTARPDPSRGWCVTHGAEWLPGEPRCPLGSRSAGPCSRWTDPAGGPA